jgi:hypothetical protein
MPLCPPEIQYKAHRGRSRIAAVRCQVSERGNGTCVLHVNIGTAQWGAIKIHCHLCISSLTVYFHTTFLILKKKNISRLMRSPCCLCVFWMCISPYQLLNPWTSLYETCMYIMAPEPMSTAYFINPFHQSVYLYVYFRVSLLGTDSANTFPRQRRIVGGVVSVRSVTYQRRVCGSVCVSPLSLLGNGSVNTFPCNEELLEASFSLKSVSYQSKVGD